MKSLRDISLDITEEEYRQDPALSYSTLAKYEREGFGKIDSLFDKVESPSLLLGSLVDCRITGTEEEFNERFMIADFPVISDSVISIIKHLFEMYGGSYRSINDIPNDNVLAIIQEHNYQSNWKPDTRVKVIKEKGVEYYSLLFLAGNRTIVDTETNDLANNMVEVLKNCPATIEYFAPDNPFDNIKRYYQLKFKANLNGSDYRCMCDLLVVDYTLKKIYPIDLKTSFKHEYEFYKSFIDWSYQIQARLYWRIIRANMDRDEYFKDFELDDYRFIVVSRDLHPLVWRFNDTQTVGELRYGRLEDIVMRDPEVIGKELRAILDNTPTFPSGINAIGDNDITDWINKTHY